MAGRDGAVGQGPLHPGGQLEEPQGVGDGGPALAHPAGHLLVGVAELVDQLLEGGRLLQRVEVLAVEVLDQGLLQAVDIGDASAPAPASSAARPAGPPATGAHRR